MKTQSAIKIQKIVIATLLWLTAAAALPILTYLITLTWLDHQAAIDPTPNQNAMVLSGLIVLASLFLGVAIFAVGLWLTVLKTLKQNQSP